MRRHVPVPRNVGRDGRRPRRERLEERVREPLARRRQDEDLGTRLERRHVAPRSEEGDPGLDPERARERPERGLLLARPRDLEARGLHHCDRPEQAVEALLSVETPAEEDEPRLLPSLPREGPEVHAVRDRDDLRGVEPVRERLLLERLRHADVAVEEAYLLEPPLAHHGEITVLPRARELADDGRPRPPRDPQGVEPAAVVRGVDHVDPTRAREEGARRALEDGRARHRDAVDRDPRKLEAALAVAPRRDRRDADDPVPARREPRRELARLALHAALLVDVVEDEAYARSAQRGSIVD